MDKNHVGLSSIIPFTDDGRWYLKLIYKYEDKVGNKHTVVIPKANVPFAQGYVPGINYLGNIRDKDMSSDHPYISCSDSMLLYESVCALASERGAKEPACYFDIITEDASREMTLDEIEKELGYKVKIVNKEKSDGNGKKM